MTRKSNRKWGALFAGCVVAVVAVGAVDRKAALEVGAVPEAPAEPPSVRVARVTVAPLEVPLRLTGEVRPLRRAQLRAETAGRVLEMPWRLGDRLEAGEVLARLDGSKNDIAIRQTRARVVQAEVAFEQASRKRTRTESLFAREKTSLESYDDAVFAQRRAEAELELRRAELAALERLGQDFVMRAPYTAFITAIDAEVGDSLVPGTPAFTLVEGTGTKVVFQVPAERVRSFQRGEGHVVEIPALDRTYEARVAAVGKEADARSRTFEVELDVEGGTDLHPGMIASLSIRLSSGRDGLFVPSEAVLEKFGGSFVFVYDDGVAREIPVEIEQREAERVALSGEFGPDTWVIAAGQHRLEDGERVQAEGDELAVLPGSF